MNLTIATSLDEALAAMAEGARPIAGGTDLVVGARVGKNPLPDRLVAIDRIEELSTISLVAGTLIAEDSDDPTPVLQIGATVSHAKIMIDPPIVQGYSGLADASALVGSPSTRNVGTIGGNVMNASPAMDTGAPLLTMGARVVLQSVSGSRTVGLTDLWTGPGQTSAKPDELCVAILIPRRMGNDGSAYVRLEYRRAMEIAVVGAGAAVTLHDDGTIAEAAIALTAVGPTIIGVEGLNDVLVGTPIDDLSLASVAALASDQAQPISDLRASEKYRRHTVGVMARRALEAAGRRASGESIAVPVNRAVGIGQGIEQGTGVDQ